MKRIVDANTSNDSRYSMLYDYACYYKSGYNTITIIERRSV